MNTEKKPTGVRFNLFDVILILVIVSCIAGLAFHMYYTKDLAEDYTETATIAISISDVSEQTAIAFCVNGAPIYSQETDTKIGVLDTTEYGPLVLDLETEQGILVKATHPEKKSIRATATFIGTWTEDGFLIDGTKLATIGTTLKIYTGGAVCTITITDIVR